MILAVLFSNDTTIAAAAPACDQMPWGDRYWSEIHAAEPKIGPGFETAYIQVNDDELRSRLMAVGIDDDVCGRDLANVVANITRPSIWSNRAA